MQKKLMKSPQISIIMPNFNGEKYLELSIESFLLQNYKNKELIIVDKKSIDNSHKIIRKYSSKYKEIFWIKQTDKGISDAINIGISKSSGDIIGFLGSDDILYRDILNEIAFNYQFINFDVIYFDSITYWPKKKKAKVRVCPSCSFNKNNVLKYGIVGGQDIYFKKHIFNKYQFDIENKYCMDFEFLLKISNENYLFHYINKIATINILDQNISHLKAFEQRQEARRVARKYSHSLKELLLLCRRWRKDRLNYFKFKIRKCIKGIIL